MSAVTDSLGIIQYDPEHQPGVSNLLTILSSLNGESIESIVERYKGKGYGDFKKEVGAAVFDFLSELQAKYKEISPAVWWKRLLQKEMKKQDTVRTKS